MSCWEKKKKRSGLLKRKKKGHKWGSWLAFHKEGERKKLQGRKRREGGWSKRERRARKRSKGRKKGRRRRKKEEGKKKGERKEEIFP